MMLDAALALNALIWFASLILPAFGFAKGYYGQRPVLIRAQLILASLLALLLATVQGLQVIATPDQAVELNALRDYQAWAAVGVACGIVLSWVTFCIGSWRAARRN